jgi:DinB superfamily
VSERIAGELLRIVDSAEPSLRALRQDDVIAARRPGAWSRLEILGHLIDSAANNHQRYVRVQSVDELRFADYDQEAWVACQEYRTSQWGDLVDLWASYNRHLAHVLDVLPSASLDTPCRVGESQSGPLRELVDQYLAHMRHHLAQLIGQGAAVERTRRVERHEVD